MENKENSSHCHQEVVLSTLCYPNDCRWNQLITIYNLSDYFMNRGKLITIGHILTCGWKPVEELVLTLEAHTDNTSLNVWLVRQWEINSTLFPQNINEWSGFKTYVTILKLFPKQKTSRLTPHQWYKLKVLTYNIRVRTCVLPCTVCYLSIWVGFMGLQARRVPAQPCLAEW